TLLSSRVRLRLSLCIRDDPYPTLFPYTTLFRSRSARVASRDGYRSDGPPALRIRGRVGEQASRWRGAWGGVSCVYLACGLSSGRSEEHTSELQSRENIVCRLLLDKKKMYA